MSTNRPCVPVKGLHGDEAVEGKYETFEGNFLLVLDDHNNLVQSTLRKLISHNNWRNATGV